MSQLIDNMTELQKQMQDVEARLSQSSNVTLNDDGKKMQAEARRGFTPLEQYMKSSEPEQTAAARHLAYARTLWRDLDLTPNSQPPDQLALDLLNAVGALYESEAVTARDLAAAFREQAAANPALGGIEADRVAAFIVKRRREDAGEPSDPDAVPFTTPAAMEPVVAPMIAVPDAAPSWRDLEPFRYWLFGMQDRGTRTLAAVACVAMVAVLGIVALDALGSWTRSQAYQAISMAAAQDDDKAVVTEAERFLTAWTLRAIDLREERVRNLLIQAREAPNLRIRNAAAERMREALRRGDRDAAIEAAERFLDAPPVQVADPRQEEVLDLYAREFSMWFADFAEPMGEAERTRIEHYRKLANATRINGRGP